MIAHNAPRQEHYAWGWLFGIIAVFVLIAMVLIHGPRVPTFSQRIDGVSEGHSQSYYLIRMPAIPANDDTLAARAESWLQTIATRGYRPMLLSDIHQRIKEGRALPEKAIVLLFDPGYRQTFEVISPMLAKYRFPAVWVSDEADKNTRDRRYVSTRMQNAMKESGTWDIARYEGNALVIDSKNEGRIVIGQQNGAWKPNAGRRALNRGLPEESLNRLHVNWNWSDRQMIDRLMAEEPLKGASYLTATKIAKHYWGTVLPATTGEDVTFSMKAPMDGRTANISWLGTRGVNDAQFDLEIQGLSGELWLLMRSDDDTGSNIGVCFANGNVSIAEHKGADLRQYVNAPTASLYQPATFKATVVLNGSHLAVYVNGANVATTDRVPAAVNEDTIVRMVAYDKIVGGAQVESVKIGVKRLTKNSKEGEI